MCDIKLGQIEDKEMIKSEEREKMLNEENAKDCEFQVINEKASLTSSSPPSQTQGITRDLLNK